jgi:hypothetical protein
MPNDEPSRESLTLALERERQKTKRYFLSVGVIGVLGLLGIWSVLSGEGTPGKRTVDLNILEGKFTYSTDQPIVEKVEPATATYEGEPGQSVQYTTGEIAPEVIDEVEQVEAVRPDHFTGPNLINREAGFVIPVRDPEKWNLAYNPAGYTNSTIPVNEISARDGMGNVRVTLTTEGVQGYTIEGAVQEAVGSLMAIGVLAYLPEVSYDYASQTAFLSFTNPLTNGASYMKMILHGDTAYVVTANYNNTMTNQATIAQLRDMVAKFTLIGS